MARNWVGRWEGGRTRLGRKGETVWVIERARGPKRYSISLPVHSQVDAMAELALFERDPNAYQGANTPARGDVVGDVPTFRATLIVKFLDDKRSGADSVCKAHAVALTHYLRAWSAKFGGRDLRTITLAEYRDALRGMKPRRQHIVALRSYTHWLREQGILSSAQDFSRDVKVPQPTVRRAARSLGYSMEDFAALYGAIRSRPARAPGPVRNPPEVVAAAVAARAAGEPFAAVCARYGVSHTVLAKWLRRAANPTPPARIETQAIRDVLTLRALCGMHHSEVERLAEGHWKVKRLDVKVGAGPGAVGGEIAGTVTFMHKNGAPHPQALCRQALLAAERLQKARKAPDKKAIHRAMDEAAASLGLPKMRPGELRHSFVTWARTHGRVVRPAEGGVSLDVIASVVGHTTTKTTSTYYDNTTVPPLIVLPIRLENVEDPALDGRPLKMVG